MLKPIRPAAEAMTLSADPDLARDSEAAAARHAKAMLAVLRAAKRVCVADARYEAAGIAWEAFAVRDVPPLEKYDHAVEMAKLKGSAGWAHCGKAKTAQTLAHAALAKAVARLERLGKAT